jgi:hypothetical protein
VWRFTGGFPLKLRTMDFLFRGFRGRNARVEIKRGALYQSFILLSNQFTVATDQNLYNILKVHLYSNSRRRNSRLCPYIVSIL